MDFLAFVDEIGRTIDGKYIYRFDFTMDTELVWGEYFNVTPTAIVPKLQPDINALSITAKAIFPIEMALARKNYCFSMQDCIDGILPLIFSEIDDEMIEVDEKPFFIRFGESFENVVELLNKIDIELFDVTEVEKGSEKALDDLIDAIEGEKEDDGE